MARRRARAGRGGSTTAAVRATCGARRRDRRDRPDQHAELAAREELRIAAEASRRRGGAAVRPREPAQAIPIDVGRDLGGSCPRSSARTVAPATGWPSPSSTRPSIAAPRASASSGTPWPASSSTPPGDEIAGRERIGDPARRSARPRCGTRRRRRCARSAAPDRRRPAAARPRRPRRCPRRDRSRGRRRSRRPRAAARPARTARRRAG